MTQQIDSINTPAYRKKILVSSMIGLGFEGMDIMFLSFALTSIIASFHISSAQAGSIATITNIGMLVGGVVFGMLADKLGRIRVFSYTIFLFAIATLLLAFCQNLTSVSLLRFIAGIGGGGEYGIGMALVAEVFTREKRARMISWVGIGGQCGAVLAAVIAAVVLPIWGWRALFVIGIIPVFLVFFIRRNLKETPAWLLAKKQNKQSKQSINATYLFSSSKQCYLTISLIIMASIQVAGYYGLMSWLPSILQHELGLSISSSSLWMISTIIGMCIGMLVFGQIMDRLGAVFAFGLFLLASACCVMLYVYVSSSTALLISGAIVGFFANGMSAGYGALISSCFPTMVRTTANNVIFNLGRAIGGFSPIAIGYFLDNYSISAAMSFLTVLYIVSFIVLMGLKCTKMLINLDAG